jgi:hypothetical protein
MSTIVNRLEKPEFIFTARTKGALGRYEDIL